MAHSAKIFGFKVSKLPGWFVPALAISGIIVAFNSKSLREIMGIHGEEDEELKNQELIKWDKIIGEEAGFWESQGVV